MTNHRKEPDPGHNCGPEEECLKANFSLVNILCIYFCSASTHGKRHVPEEEESQQKLKTLNYPHAEPLSIH